MEREGVSDLSVCAKGLRKVVSQTFTEATTARYDPNTKPSSREDRDSRTLCRG